MARQGPRGSEFFDVASGVAEVRWDGSRATLFLDGVESSCIDVEDPQDLEFEYMQHMTVILDAHTPPHRPVHALHLGAAACALPSAWEAARPGSRQVAVEVDALLAELVRRLFDLPRSPALRIRIGEGRQVMASTRPASWDVVVRDAFDHGRVPAALATLEAARDAARALVPGGLYLVNTPHGGGLDARAEAAALLEVFPDVLAVADPKVVRSARRGNVVLAARTPGPAGPRVWEVDRGLRRLALPARVLEGAGLRRWIAGARPPRDPAPGTAAPQDSPQPVPPPSPRAGEKP